MNKEEIKKYQREWYLKNKKRHSEAGRRYYITNKDKLNKNAKRYYENNKDLIGRKHKEYRIKNRDILNAKHREYNKKYLEKNRDKINKAKKLRYSRDKEKHFSGQIKRKYGMGIDEYNKLLIKQNHCCAICFKKEKNRRLATDHCHSTGRIRGLLCFSCNSAIGHFSDNVDNLNNAIIYLSKSS